MLKSMLQKLLTNHASHFCQPNPRGLLTNFPESGGKTTLGNCKSRRIWARIFLAICTYIDAKSSAPQILSELSSNLWIPHLLTNVPLPTGPVQIYLFSYSKLIYSTSICLPCISFNLSSYVDIIAVSIVVKELEYNT